MNELLTSCPVCQANLSRGGTECRRCGTSLDGLLANQSLAARAIEKQRLELLFTPSAFYRLG